MKTKTTLEWAETYLRKFAKDNLDPTDLQYINETIQLHAAQSDRPSEKKLEDLERRIQNLESDAAVFRTRNR